MLPKSKWLPLVISILLVAGCKAVVLNYEETFDVTPVHGKQISIDPVTNNQKIKVVVAATGDPVSVFIYLAQDEQEVKKIIRSKKIAAPVLQYQEKVQNTTLEADIPANNAAVVSIELTSGKKATVTAKITN